MISAVLYFLVLFSEPAHTEIYTLSLHDALPISTTGVSQRVIESTKPLLVKNAPIAKLLELSGPEVEAYAAEHPFPLPVEKADLDRKSTRLNSSHITISYAVFCLKKKNKKKCHSQ